MQETLNSTSRDRGSRDEMPSQHRAAKVTERPERSRDREGAVDIRHSSGVRKPDQRLLPFVLGGSGGFLTGPLEGFPAAFTAFFALCFRSPSGSAGL
jgi:hypothetical protein